MSQPDNPTVSRLMKAMDEHFRDENEGGSQPSGETHETGEPRQQTGPSSQSLKVRAATEDEGLTKNQPERPDSAKAPALRTAAPQRPRERESYERVKRLEDDNRDEWLYDWVEEHGDLCFFCERPVDFANFEVHHKDKAFIPLNARENTALSHPTCNRSNREFESSAPQVPRERELALRQDRYSLGVLDGTKGNPTSEQRARFDDWKRGKASLPCMEEFEFPLLRGLRGRKPQRIWEKLAYVSEKAVYGCGLGSSKTYRTHILEDVAGGVFEQDTRGRDIWISYTEEFAEIALYWLEQKELKDKRSKTEE